MQIKVFGKDLFEYKGKKSNLYYQTGVSALKDSKFLPDFYQLHGGGMNEISNWVIMADNTVSGGAVAVPVKKEAKEKEVIHLTPKGVHELKMLNDEAFKLNVDPEYVDSQLSDFKDKLALIKSEEYDMARGVQEIASIVVRLENRKKYEEVKDFFEAYPYTTNAKIDELVKLHDYLRLGQVAQFVADMPKEAIQTMKDYNTHTSKISGKQAVFYIIADKKDFEKTNKRRDPILLAQSPFGHFWQILGAWDKEMLFLDQL
jgi:hypothetical protein